ncbi:MAG: hypothetical protein IPJ06_03905 [Saprospiraceae bacterium]|nr:hypothetical protein [Saprospiraceae bacterium]
MYKQILKQINNEIDWMALVPLLLFFVVFAIVLVAVFAERKVHMDYMAQLPLQDDISLKEPQS